MKNDQYTYAGFSIRLFAFIIDFIPLSIASYFLSIGFSINSNSSKVEVFLFISLYYIFVTALNSFLLMKHSCTPGMKLFRLRVVNQKYFVKIDFYHAFNRQLFLLPSIFFVLFLPTNNKNQMLHDQISKSIVILEN